MFYFNYLAHVQGKEICEIYVINKLGLIIFSDFAQWDLV